MRPDPERIDVVCIGALIRAADGEWHIHTDGSVKLACLHANKAAERLPALASNLRSLLDESSSTIQEARTMLDRLRSSVQVHPFDGTFTYANPREFTEQVNIIMAESVLWPDPSADGAKSWTERPTRIQTRLRRQFKEMGILGETNEPMRPGRVYVNYPISVKHNMSAAFALRNAHLMLTETIDFSGATGKRRQKSYEAQAKCLAMQTALSRFGPDTERFIIIQGGGAAHAARDVDLLSTAGRLYALESHEDMSNYFGYIAEAAGTAGSLGAHMH